MLAGAVLCAVQEQEEECGDVTAASESDGRCADMCWAGAGLGWCCAAPASFIQPAPASASMAATTGSRVTPSHRDTAHGESRVTCHV